VGDGPEREGGTGRATVGADLLYLHGGEGTGGFVADALALSGVALVGVVLPGPYPDGAAAIAAADFLMYGEKRASALARVS
jgi:hypothetical protein